MTPYPFPRPRDDKPHAWGLDGDTPTQLWERFSPAYEAQAQRIARAFEASGCRVEFSGAGSEDGEYIVGLAKDGNCLALLHLEDPNEAQKLAKMDDDALTAFVTSRIEGKA